MFSSVFNPQNGFWQAISRFCDLIGLSLCWLLCSLPLFTLGASTTALYDAVFHGVRKGEDVVYGRFFRTFKHNFKTAVLTTLPAVAAVLVLVLLWSPVAALAREGSPGASALLGACLLLFCLPFGIWLLAQALLSRFTFGPGALMKNALGLALARLHLTLPPALLALLFAYLCVSFVWLPILLLPGLWALISSLCYERVFAPYLPSDEEEPS